MKRFVSLATLFVLFPSACAKDGDSKATNGSDTSDSKAASADTKAASAKGKSSQAKAKNAELAQFKCDDYLSVADVESACASKVTLSTERMVKEGPYYPCQRGNKGKFEEGSFSFNINKVLGQVPDGYETTPKLFSKTHGTVTRSFAGMVKGGYSIVVHSSKTSKSEAPCTGEQMVKLLGTISERVPAVGTLPKQRKSNPLCDKALSAETLKEVCGKAFKLRSLPVEGLSMNPCNRGGKGLNFIVSQHKDAATATRAKGVATSGPAMKGKHAVALASGPYLIEMKADKDSACGTVAKLEKLASKAAQTLK